MKRLTKEQIKHIARTGIPPPELALTVSSHPPIDVMVGVVFPPHIENHFPMVSDEITIRRTIMRALLEQMSLENDDDKLENMQKIQKQYADIVHNLCGGENEYMRAILKDPSILEWFTTLNHNLDMNEKLREYLDRACGACGNLGPWRACSRCRGIHYCGVECQKSHWVTHKMHCTSKLKQK